MFDQRFDYFQTIEIAGSVQRRLSVLKKWGMISRLRIH
jgi:hypothetical protein